MRPFLSKETVSKVRKYFVTSSSIEAFNNPENIVIAQVFQGLLRKHVILDSIKEIEELRKISVIERILVIKKNLYH